MKIQLKKYFNRANCVFFYKGGILYADWLGLHFLNEEGKEEASILDFLDADDGILFDKYLLLRNMILGFRVYDLQTKKMVTEIPLSQEEMPTAECYFVKDGNLYIAGGSMRSLFSDSIFSKNEKGENAVKNSIDVYSLLSGEKIEHIETSHSYTRLTYLPMRNAFFMIGTDEHLYYLNENKMVLPFDDILYELNDIEYNPSSNELYVVRGLGIRVYDFHFIEKNKIDFISDEQVKSLPFLRPGIWPMENDSQMMMKESVLRVLTLDNNHVVVLTNQDRGSVFNISFYDICSGDKVASIVFPNSIEDVRVLDERHISFLMKGTIHILEVID